MDWSPPGSSVQGTLQARILEWVAISFSRRSSQPRNQTQVSSIAGRFFSIWATREAPKYWSGQPIPSPGEPPDPGIKLGSPALQEDYLLAKLLGKPKERFPWLGNEPRPWWWKRQILVTVYTVSNIWKYGIREKIVRKCSYEWVSRDNQ